MIIQWFLGIFTLCFTVYIANFIGFANGFKIGYRCGFEDGSPTEEKLKLLAKDVNEKMTKTFYDGIERGRHLRDKVNNN